MSEATRDKVLDGLFGRSTIPVFINQPRRQRPDWDGCRDRYDGRDDLPNKLQYIQPLARSSKYIKLYIVVYIYLYIIEIKIYCLSN